MNAGFIGAGKAGTVLGRYFARHGLSVAGYCDASPSAAQAAASLTSSRRFDAASALADASDLLFITVPDAAIADAWHELRDTADLTGTIVCHCSGCTTSAVLDGAGDVGARACSVHPLLALSDPLCPLDPVERAHITLEGDASAVSTLQALFDGLGNPVHVIDAADKGRYHAAAVFASNLVLAPLATAARLMESCGFDAPAAREALEPLVMGNARAFCEKGAATALTGPVERNDLPTAQRHLDDLDDAAADLYRTLTKTLVSLAEQKHPDRNYADWNPVVERKANR